MDELIKEVRNATNLVTKIKEQLEDHAERIARLEEVLRHGVKALPVKAHSYDELIFTPTSDEEVKKVQDLHDAYIVYRAYCLLHGKPTEGWLERRVNEVVKQLTGSHLPNYVPIGFSARVIQLIRLKPSVANVFEELELPSEIFQPPVALSGITVSKVAAGGQVVLSTPTAPAVQFQAKKLAAGVQIVTELSEDSIVAIIPALQDELAYAFADALDKLILKGDTASPDNTLNAWDGLLKLAGTTTNTVWSAQKVLEAASTLDLFDPNEIVLIVNPADFTQMVAWSEVATVDKYGDKATILTGELAKIWGIPVVVSPHADDPVVVLHRAFRLGIRHRLEVEVQRDVRTLSDILVAYMRADFKKVVGTNVVKRVYSA